jgi:hypothetical protein
MTYNNHRLDWQLMRRGMKPYGLDRVVMPDGMKGHLGNLAFDVFTKATNTGCAFHEAILSVYLTGLENGMCAARENFGKEERKS